MNVPARRVAIGVAWTLCVAAAASAASESVDAFVARHWRMPLTPQGPPPARFEALEASLQPEACGTCHPAQLADWRTSLHAAAMGPGVAGQLAEMLETDPESALSCLECHAPLAEQAPQRRDPRGAIRPNPAFDAKLHPRGITCAACHVRGHQRFGPPKRDGSLTSALPGSQLPHNGVTRTAAYLRSEFCRVCHQFGPDGFALNGKPLEDTYREWRASRFAVAGVQCQDCHMPDRRHLWRGIHDPEMVKSGLTFAVETGPGRALLRVENTGIGHAFPTYVTPLVALRAELVDVAGRAVAGSRTEVVIARQVAMDLSRELSDTRLHPGQHAELRWSRRAAPAGTRLRFSVVVYPDAFYTRFFESLLTQGAGRGAAQIRQALEASRRSAFTVFERELAPP